MWKKTGKIIFWLWLFTVPLFAATDLFLNSFVDSDTVPINGQLTLTISMEGSINIPGINLPALKDFMVIGQSTSTQIQFINGRQSSIKSFIFTLRPQKEGPAQIPGFDFSYDGKVYKINPINITVTGYVEPNSYPQPRSNSIMDRFFNDEFFQPPPQPRFLSQKVTLEYQPRKTILFLGEKTYLDFNLYFEQPFYQGPVANFPDLDGFITEANPRDLKTVSSKKININGKIYNHITYSTSIYGSSAGTKTIPALTLQYVDNPFEGVKTLQSKSYNVTIKPLPLPQPENFSGAIGNFKIKIEFAPPSNVPANANLSLIIQLSGVGNADMVNQIILPQSEEVDWYLDSLQTIASQNLTVKKVFKYFVIPKRNGKIDFPDIEFCYFDTTSKTYQYTKAKIAAMNVLAQTSNNNALTLAEQKNNLNLDRGTLEIRLNKKNLINICLTIIKFIGIIIFMAIIFFVIFFFFRSRSLPVRRIKKQVLKLEKKEKITDEYFIKEIYALMVKIIKIKYKFNLIGATQKQITDYIGNEKISEFIIDIVAKYEELQYSKTTFTLENRTNLIKIIKEII